MDENRQITIAEWQQWKQEIKDRLNQTVENFIAIGYRLRRIQETESYRNDNFTSLSDWAKSEFGLSESTVTRFMAISAKFTVGGDGQKLLPEFEGISYSKLQEMLTLSDEDCRLITAKTTVKEIRELKQFNHDDESKYIRTEEEKAQRTPLQECIWDFFSQPGNKGLLDGMLEILGDPDSGAASIAAIADAISPSGNRTHRKGIVYLFMYDADRGVAYKLMTSPVPVKMTWEAFLEEVRTVYAPYMDTERSAWESAYGKEADPEAEIPGQMEITEVIKETENGIKSPYGEREDLAASQIVPQKPENGLNTKCGGDSGETETEEPAAPKGPKVPENVTAKAEIVEAADKTSIFKVKEATGNAGNAGSTGNTEGTDRTDSTGNTEVTDNTGIGTAGHGTDQSDQPGRDGADGRPREAEEVAGSPESGPGGSNGYGDGGRKDPVGKEETEAMTVIEWKNLWTETAKEVYTLRHFFYMDYEKLHFIDNAIPKQVMEKAYKAAINVAAGLEKMLNGKKYTS